MTLTAEDLRRVLNYDPQTGAFVWAVAPNRRIRPGSSAGTPHSRGYVAIKVLGGLYLAHRLAWLHVHGEWPDQFIDHVNGVKNDNRIANLRLANCSQNAANSKRPANNTSGAKGVRWHVKDKKWHARIWVSGKQKHLGMFECLKDAAAAYERAAVEHFGEFARAS